MPASAFTSQAASINLVDIDADGLISATQKSQHVFNTGLNIAAIRPQAIRGSRMANRHLYSSVRLVSAGFRLYKTSARENEAGVVKATYMTRG